MPCWRRNDGDLVRDLPLNRRVMPYLMPGRNESVYYFDVELALHRTDSWLREFNAAHPGLQADVFHLALWGIRECMVRYPTMNRFVAGGRLYQRRETSFSFAVKRRLQVRHVRLATAQGVRVGGEDPHAVLILDEREGAAETADRQEVVQQAARSRRRGR